MGGADEQVAAGRGQVLLPGRLDPEPEQRRRARTGRPAAGTRYSREARASGSRPSHSRPSPRRRAGTAARASGDRRDGGGRRRADAPARTVRRVRRLARPGSGPGPGRRRHLPPPRAPHRRVGGIAGSGRSAALVGRVRIVVPRSSAASAGSPRRPVGRRRRIGLVGLGRLVVLVSISSSSSGSSSGGGGSPQRSHTAPGPVAPGQQPRAAITIDATDTSIAVGIPKNVQLSSPQGLEHEPHGGVPDEEDQHEVARAHPLPAATRDPEQRDRAQDAAERLVQEQRLEAGRRLGVQRARVLGRRGGRSRSRCPTAGWSAARRAPG